MPPPPLLLLLSLLQQAQTCIQGPISREDVALLRSIKCVCLFLALKVADTVHAQNLLSFMISQVTGSPMRSLHNVDSLEVEVLRSLGWRMGPFFAEDELQPGLEERLWTEAVVQCWDP